MLTDRMAGLGGTGLSVSDGGRARIPSLGLALRGGGDEVTLDVSDPLTLGVKRTWDTEDLVVGASVGVTSLPSESERAEATVVACVVVESSEDSETDSVSASRSSYPWRSLRS